jgi:hypothetical protein
VSTFIRVILPEVKNKSAAPKGSAVGRAFAEKDSKVKDFGGVSNG